MAKALAHLAAILRHVYPTAIRRIPPDFLVRAVRFPPNKMGLTAGWHLPSNSMFVKAVIADRRSCPEVLQLMRSIRCFGRKPSGPSEEPAGKLRIALETSLSETCSAVVSAGSSKRCMSPAARGCRSVSFSNTSAESNIDLSSEHRNLIDVDTSPSSILAETMLASELDLWCFDIWWPLADKSILWSLLSLNRLLIIDDKLCFLPDLAGLLRKVEQKFINNVHKDKSFGNVQIWRNNLLR